MLLLQKMSFMVNCDFEESQNKNVQSTLFVGREGGVTKKSTLHLIMLTILVM